MDCLFGPLRAIRASLLSLFLSYTEQRFANSPPEDMVGGASSSSSSSRLFGPLNRGKLDVFISFRGEDTRKNFTCHLHEALTLKNINAFIDYELHKGDEISPSLLRAIEESYVSVVVFSKNYADSKWCLEELVKIMECRRDHGQVVIPVFYEIEPSHVRHQIGSYKAAFEKHEKNSRVEMNKVQKWKDALTEAANLSGWDSDSRSCRDYSELIQKIVEDVLQKLDNCYPPYRAEGLIGISTNSAPLEQILREAQSVGIWGMGGIGKTTIAGRLFEKHSRQYKGSCFLENVRERSGQCGQGLRRLRDELYSNLLRQDVCTTRSTFTEHRLHRQSNFIVLDDVSSSEQLKKLVGELQSFGPGSRIIITSRDKSVLESTRVEHIYSMKELDDEESLKLLSLNAFNEECPKRGYEEMSRRAIVYCKGIPLALTVLGSLLISKSEREWDSALKKLVNIPDQKIQNVLKVSYEELSHEEKQIFLDIACIFKGEEKDHAIDIFDSCRLYGDIGIRSLCDKALINIYRGCVWMHDLIQEMGWEIVRQESIENPEKRSRLWDFNDICDVFKNNEGTVAIKGIKLDMSQSRQNLCLSSDAFKKMPSLKYLSNTSGCLELPNGLESLPNELRYIKWHGYPLQTLPSNFCAEKLVTLIMCLGQFKRLWDGEQNLVNLKRVKLTGCTELTELPDFSQAPKLKRVDLSGCRKLRTLEIHSTSLTYLRVSGCVGLRKFSLSAEVEEDRNLTTSEIKVLDPSIEGVKNRFENLPEELSGLKSLKTLKLSGCGQVVSERNLGRIFWQVQGFVELYLDKCNGLFELPSRIKELRSLEVLVLDESNVKNLPKGIEDLSKLKTLSLRGCRFLQSLPRLPSSICHLDALNCTGLHTLQRRLFWYPPQEERKYLSFQNCVKLDLDKFISYFQLYVSLLADRDHLPRRRRIPGAGERQRRLEDRLVIVYTDDKVPKLFTHQSKGASITCGLPPPSDHDLSLLLCVVLSPATFPLLANTINIRCECYLEDGGKQQSIEGFVFECPIENTMEDGEVNRVCMSYDFGFILEKTNACRGNNQSASTSYNPKVTFKFSVDDQTTCDQNFRSVIKECGVYFAVESNVAMKTYSLMNP